MRQHKGVKWDDGRILKASLDTGFGQQLQSYQLNLRRPQFQDMRVREALGYTYDFDTLNKTGRLHARQQRVQQLASSPPRALPTPGELKLLEPFRAELPPRVFGPAFVAPRTANNPKGLRANLLKARALLEEAGWKLGDRRQAAQLPRARPLEFEYMVAARRRQYRGLAAQPEEAGHHAEGARWSTSRSTAAGCEKYDFDMVAHRRRPTSRCPTPADQAVLYGSKSADEQGNSNFRGVKSRAVDALIEAMGRATTLDAAARRLRARWTAS